MSVIAAALKHMLAAGMPHDAIVAAVEAMEASLPVREEPIDPVERRRLKARERQARYEEKKRQEASEERQKASENVSERQVASELTLPLSLPSSPPAPPQLPTHTRGISSRARKAARFGEFWELYPSKVGKKAAVKAYDGALADLTDPDPEETIIAGLRRAIPGWSSGKFIPNPATWLNQGRWDDQPAGSAVQRSTTPLEALAAAPDPNDRWRRRVNAYLYGSKFWNTTDWEEPPGKPGCIVPAEILREFGLGADVLPFEGRAA